jgi:hypothetical protein
MNNNKKKNKKKNISQEIKVKEKMRNTEFRRICIFNGHAGRVS